MNKTLDSQIQIEFDRIFAPIESFKKTQLERIISHLIISVGEELDKYTFIKSHLMIPSRDFYFEGFCGLKVIYDSNRMFLIFIRIDSAYKTVLSYSIKAEETHYPVKITPQNSSHSFETKECLTNTDSVLMTLLGILQHFSNEIYAEKNQTNKITNPDTNS